MESIALLSLPAAADDVGTGVSDDLRLQGEEDIIERNKQNLPTYENWATCGELFPHAKAVLVYRPANRNLVLQWAEILYNAAWYAKELGSYFEAEQMDLQALDARRKLGIGYVLCTCRRRSIIISDEIYVGC